MTFHKNFELFLLDYFRLSVRRNSNTRFYLYEIVILFDCQNIDMHSALITYYSTKRSNSTQTSTVYTVLKSLEGISCVNYT